MREWMLGRRTDLWMCQAVRRWIGQWMMSRGRTIDVSKHMRRKLWVAYHFKPCVWTISANHNLRRQLCDAAGIGDSLRDNHHPHSQPWKHLYQKFNIGDANEISTCNEVISQIPPFVPRKPVSNRQVREIRSEVAGTHKLGKGKLGDKRWVCRVYDMAAALWGLRGNNLLEMPQQLCHSGYFVPNSLSSACLPPPLPHGWIWWFDPYYLSFIHQDWYLVTVDHSVPDASPQHDDFNERDGAEAARRLSSPSSVVEGESSIIFNSSQMIVYMWNYMSNIGCLQMPITWGLETARSLFSVLWSSGDKIQVLLFCRRAHWFEDESSSIITGLWPRRSSPPAWHGIFGKRLASQPPE